MSSMELAGKISNFSDLSLGMALIGLELFIRVNHTASIFRLIVFLRVVLRSLENGKTKALSMVYPSCFTANQKQERDMSAALPESVSDFM